VNVWQEIFAAVLWCSLAKLCMKN